MRRLLLALPILLAMLFPTVGVYGWSNAPYAVTQLIDVNDMIMWMMIGRSNDFDYAVDSDGDGNVDAFGYWSMAYSADGQYFGEAYVEVDLLFNTIYIYLYVNIDGNWVFKYYILNIIFILPMGDGLYSCIGYNPGDAVTPMSVASVFAYVPFEIGGELILPR